MLNLEVIGEGATTKVYRDGETAIKLYTNVSYEAIEHEAKLQTFAVTAGLPAPAIFGIRKLDENAVVLNMAYIDGKPLIHGEMTKDDRRLAIDMLVKLQCMVHKVNANGLPKQKDVFAWKIEHTPHFGKVIKNKALALLSRLDTGTLNLCHGDFHLLNILYDGHKHWIIDWVDATAGNPLADVCRSYIIFKQYLNRLSGIYLRAFCKEAGVSQEDVLAWLPVVAAARLNENMDDKMRAVLLDIVNENI